MLTVVRQRLAELRDRRHPLERVVELPARGRTRGRILVSYLREPLRWGERDRRLAGHSNQWECREIVAILRGLGLAADVVDFRDHEFVPQRRYDAVLALDGELVRLAAAADPSVRLLHLTGAHGPFQNAAERGRLEELRARRGAVCEPRRTVADVAGAERALEAADACSLIGNDWTLSTYPAEHRAKIATVPVTGTRPLPPTPDPTGREFLWFFGSGAVHKGLDRVLEAFATLPERRLHVIGNVAGETDFWAAYAAEAALPNVSVHGYLEPASRAFAAATARCGFLVAPSCSEGTSPAVVTMLQAGLLPIVTRETGVTLAAGEDYLADPSPQGIAAACAALAARSDAELRARSATGRADALERYSRRAFTAAMRRHLEGALA